MLGLCTHGVKNLLSTLKGDVMSFVMFMRRVWPSQRSSSTWGGRTALRKLVPVAHTTKLGRS